MLVLSTNADQKFLETEFLIAICHKMVTNHIKTLYQATFDPHLSIVNQKR